jgi:HD-GYP domain-containing protein (c-di-GMP phosphodiesterase class II)
MAFWGGLIHDIGKLDVDITVLSKEDRLTNEEFEHMKTHTSKGYDRAKDRNACNFALDIIRSHHERPDGKGYPDKLRNESIPVMARILSLVDSFDVMFYGRKYQQPKDLKAIIAEIERCAGSQFDADITPLFIEFVRKILKVQP